MIRLILEHARPHQGPRIKILKTTMTARQTASNCGTESHESFQDSRAAAFEEGTHPLMTKLRQTCCQIIFTHEWGRHMTIKHLLSTLLIAGTAATSLAPVNVHAQTANETRYPVVLAHGMAGWDTIAGYSYFGEDGWGTFVGDSCQFMELNGCNDWISKGQQKKTEAFPVSSFNSSEVRGDELYNHLRNFLATTGASKLNLIGHSQGGMDIRKAAHRLKTAYGTSKVGAMISISSPHRGSPYAKRILDMKARNVNNIFCGALPPAANGDDPCLQYMPAVIDLLFDGVNLVASGTTAPNNAIAGALQLIYNDYDANDGKTTGAKAFNQKYPMAGVAGYVGSVITAQDDRNLTPLLATLGAAITFNADGDGACTGDCDNDGSAGQGDGSVYDMDDDGLVGINSQQMGYRLKYTAKDWECTSSVLGVCVSSRDPLDTFSEVSSTGYVGDLNAPSSTQMNSHDGKLSQDHLDVISIGPDSLDEEEFYAGLFQHIYNKGY